MEPHLIWVKSKVQYARVILHFCKQPVTEMSFFTIQWLLQLNTIHFVWKKLKSLRRLRCFAITTVRQSSLLCGFALCSSLTFDMPVPVSSGRSLICVRGSRASTWAELDKTRDRCDRALAEAPAPNTGTPAFSPPSSPNLTACPVLLDCSLLLKVLVYSYSQWTLHQTAPEPLGDIDGL
jgi:hypothetical protein